MMKLVRSSQTDVCLCYLRDEVSNEVLQDIRARLRQHQSCNRYGRRIRSLLSGGRAGLVAFSAVWASPNGRIPSAEKISEGRVAVLVDGTLNVLIVPYLFVEYFQNMDDYAHPPFFRYLYRGG